MQVGQVCDSPVEQIRPNWHKMVLLSINTWKILMVVSSFNWMIRWAECRLSTCVHSCKPNGGEEYYSEKDYSVVVPKTMFAMEYAQNASPQFDSRKNEQKGFNHHMTHCSIQESGRRRYSNQTTIC